MGWSFGEEMDFSRAAAFAAGMVENFDDVPLQDGTILNVNVPAGPIEGARVCTLGKRIYRDRLEQTGEDGGRKTYRIYGDDPSYVNEDGTDFEAIAEGNIAVTPVHFDLTSRESIEALARFDLNTFVGEVSNTGGASEPEIATSLD